MNDLFREEAMRAHAQSLSLIGSPRLSPTLSRKVWALLWTFVAIGLVQVALIRELSNDVVFDGAVVRDASRDARVGAPATGGVVASVDVAEGRRVERGERLYTIDASGHEATAATAVEAPVGGTIVALRARVGFVARPDETLAVIEVDGASLEVRLAVSRDIAATMSAGQTLDLRFDSRATGSVRAAGIVDRVWQPVPADEHANADAPMAVAVSVADLPHRLRGLAPHAIAGIRVTASLVREHAAWTRPFLALYALATGRETQRG